MVTDYKKFDLFGKPFIQKIDLKPPFKFVFPVADQACFLYMLKGEMEYRSNDDNLEIATHHSLLLNCIKSSRKMQEIESDSDGEIVIITFHPDILRKVYDKEIPFIFQPGNWRASQY